MHKNLFFICIVFALGCQSIQRLPGSDTEASEIHNLYVKQVEYQRIVEQEELLKKSENIKINDESLKSIADGANKEKIHREILKRKADLAAPYAGRSDLPIRSNIQLQYNWREQSERIKIFELDPYLVSSQTQPKIIYMSVVNTQSYILELQNHYFSKVKGHTTQENMSYDYFLDAEIQCDVPIRLKEGLRYKSYKAKRKVSFKLYDFNLNGQRLKIKMDSSVKSCLLTWKNPYDSDKDYAIEFVPESSHFKTLPHHQMVQACYLPIKHGLSKIQQLFLSSEFDEMTCPQIAPSLKTLENPLSGLKEKMRLLLGYVPDQQFFEKGDPYANLDFSGAPQLDEIYISYLVFRRDFYGTILQRLLEFHAGRGTLIRILVADVISLDKDKEMFREMTSKFTNIKIQEYRWQLQEFFTIKDFFDTYHRTNHVKIFATYSKRSPELNAVMLGGRNIHDAFAFKTAVNLKKYPKLVQYREDENFIHWRDLETLIQDPDITESVIGHFMTLWEMDSRTFLQRSLSVNIPTEGRVHSDYFNSKNALFRHFISFPFKDSYSLEQFYVNMFDAAERKILLSTPYFHLTQRIADSLKRAIERGVKITLVTRLDLKGDTFDKVISDVNKKAVNEYYSLIDIYEYTEHEVILHTKAVLIDDELTFTGAVNLNRRSFLHDTENGMLVYSRDYHKKLESLIQDYLKSSRKIQSEQKVRWLNKLIFKLEFVDQAL